MNMKCNSCSENFPQSSLPPFPPVCILKTDANLSNLFGFWKGLGYQKGISRLNAPPFFAHL